MGLRISTNIPSLSVQRILETNTLAQTRSYQRLASGNRFTDAGDDAAGLAISETIRAQLRSITQAARNANESISLAQVAEGGLTELSNIMIRLRELSIQAASDTVGERERGFINEEVQSLVKEADRIANVTTFSGVSLLNGQASKSQLEFQVGFRNDEYNRVTFNTEDLDVRASSLGIDGLSFDSIDSARDGIEKVDEAMTKVFTSRAKVGAIQNRLESTIRNVESAKESLAAARSKIADTDVAAETAELSKRTILQAAGISVLAQANTSPNQALRLLS